MDRALYDKGREHLRKRVARAVVQQLAAQVRAVAQQLAAQVGTEAMQADPPVWPPWMTDDEIRARWTAFAAAAPAAAAGPAVEAYAEQPPPVAHSRLRDQVRQAWMHEHAETYKAEQAEETGGARVLGYKWFSKLWRPPCRLVIGCLLLLFKLWSTSLHFDVIHQFVLCALSTLFWGFRHKISRATGEPRLRQGDGGGETGAGGSGASEEGQLPPARASS